LAGFAGFDGIVSRVVWPRGDLIDVERACILSVKEHPLERWDGPSAMRNNSMPNTPAPSNVFAAFSASVPARVPRAASELRSGAKTRWQIFSLWTVSTVG
jgi:hypothetical protein